MDQAPPAQNHALLVDPDAEHRRTMRESIQESHLELIEVGTLAEAMEYATRESPRLVLSELVLPDGSGFALCRQMRENSAISETPIMLISRWCSERDRILAFECGADDFLAKPYFKRELASRIKAVLRRSRNSVRIQESQLNTTPERVSIDEERREVRFEGQALSLTPREYDLLAALLNHQGCVMTRGELIAEAWTTGENPTERSVDAHIKSLRRKLLNARGMIETVRGLGYRFREPRGPERKRQSS